MKLVTKTSMFLYNSLVILLSLASFWRVFSFSLWKDDWSLIWSSLYNTYYYHGYFNHPGTPLEFFLFSRLFGTQAILWQSFGFLLHIFVSILVGAFIQELISSAKGGSAFGGKKAGFLAGVFFAVSYLGLETIYFASVNVIQLATIPLLLSLMYFLKILRSTFSKKYFLLFIFYFLLSISLDPPRIAPIIVLFPLLLFLVEKNKTILFFRKIALYLYPLFLFIITVGLVIWFQKYSLDTLIGKAMHQGTLTPAFLLSKLHVAGHFFATIANMFTGLIYSMGQDEQNTAMYSPIFAYIGVAIFLGTIGSFGAWVKSKKRVFGLTTFFLIWIFLFYFPNWVSEPRAPMAGAHRYVFLSSIGFVGLVAYVFSLVKQKQLLIFLSVLFIFLNIYKANTILAWQYIYRSSTIVTNIWNTINNDVPQKETNSIFMFFGQQPWVSEDIGLSGQAPFALLRRYSTDPTQMPIFTTDTKAIDNYLCYPNQKIINLFFIAYKKDRIPLSHIHSWDVLPGGKLIDISEKERKILRIQAEQHGCVVLP